MSDVSTFGAVGDGSADDTNALQHALAAGDGLLDLNRGTYRITRPLVLDLTQRGYGAVRGAAGTTRLVMAGPGPAIRLLGDHRGSALPRTVLPATWEKERFPIVSGLEILGEHPEAVGIELRKTMQATVSHVLVRSCRYGIHLVERNRNFILADSHLYDNSVYGLFFDRCNLHQIIVHGNHISYNQRAGIRSLGGDVHNLQITGNDIEYNNRPGVDTPEEGGAEIWFEADDGVISEVTIASNTIQATVQPGGANVRIHGSAKETLRGACLVAITGNVLGSQTRGIDLAHAQRVTVTGNTIYNSSEFSILARRCVSLIVGTNTFGWRDFGAESPQDGIRLEDCVNALVTGLSTDQMAAGGTEPGPAITLVRCRDSAVQGCQLVDPPVCGIALEECHRCRVSDNSILDSRPEKRMQHGLRATGGSDNLLQHNFIRGSQGEPIDADAAAAILHGNNVEPGS